MAPHPDDLAREVDPKPPLQVVISAVSMLQLTGLVQLALRHSGLDGASGVRDTAERFLDGARQYFADCPAVTEVIAQGDRSEEPAEAPRVVHGQRLGPTGRFPYGSGSPHDEGELAAALAIDRAHGVIRIDFGTAVRWVSVSASGARAFAAVLVEKAAALDKAAM